MEILIGNVWEAINYTMFRGKQKTKRTTSQYISKIIDQVGKKMTVWSVWKKIKILKSTATIFKLMKANLGEP